MRSGPALERVLQIFIELADQELCHDKNDSMLSFLSGGVALWLCELRWSDLSLTRPRHRDECADLQGSGPIGITMLE